MRKLALAHSEACAVALAAKVLAAAPAAGRARAGQTRWIAAVRLGERGFVTLTVVLR